MTGGCCVTGGRCVTGRCCVTGGCCMTGGCSVTGGCCVTELFSPCCQASQGRVVHGLVTPATRVQTDMGNNTRRLDSHSSKRYPALLL